MNASRARDYFSEYYEGSLEPALKLAFEQRLESDTALRAEYDDFVSAMELLGGIADEEIEAPIYLSDRIATRLDEAIAKKPVGAASWLGWFRNLGFAGVAGAVVLVAAIAGIGGNETARASILGIGGSKAEASGNELEYRISGASVIATFQGRNGRDLIVDGKRMGSQVEVPFDNDNATAYVFSVKVDGRADEDKIVVPGKDRSREPQGTGTVVEFATAVADYYGVPVRLSVANTEGSVAWSFTHAEASLAVTAALTNTKYVIDKRSGIVCITGG